MKLSQFKKSLWSHPQLLGYIDVDTVLEPVITRDEFKRHAAVMIPTLPRDED